MTLFKQLFDMQYAAKNPIGIQLQQDCAPIDGTTEFKRNALSKALSVAPKMDYVFSDFEFADITTRYNNINEMVSIVRGQAEQSKKNAWIAAYDQYPGANNPSHWWPWATDRTEYSNRYIESSQQGGLNIANPACYPYAYFSTHYWSGEWSAGRNGFTTDMHAPNIRSAMFWGPLEKLSVAARSMLPGDLLIPWVNVIVPSTNHAYPTLVPERSDVTALLQHMRLRGADGFYGLGINSLPMDTVNDLGEIIIPPNSWIRNYTITELRQDYLSAWHALDSYCSDLKRSYYNLSTNKLEGIQWSAARSGNKLVLLVSNLNTATKTVIFPETFPVLPDGTTSVSVPGNTHQTLTYTIDNFLKNGEFNTSASWNLTNATYRTNEGINGTGCLKLQGGVSAAMGTKKIKTEPGANMRFSYNIKGQSDAKFKLGCQYYDKNGIACGTDIITMDKTTNSVYTNYSDDFIVKMDSAIYSMVPILYNVNGATDSNDIIWADNLNVSFVETTEDDNHNFSAFEVLNESNDRVLNLTPSSYIKARITVRNANVIDRPFSIILALYENGIIKNIALNSTNVLNTGGVGQYEVGLTLPEELNPASVLKAFVWENLNTSKPINKEILIE
jgi:hypothetical protein